MAQRINTARVNRIVNKLRNLTIIQENADVIIYLDDSGNIKDILITGQRSVFKRNQNGDSTSSAF